MPQSLNEQIVVVSQVNPNITIMLIFLILYWRVLILWLKLVCLLNLLKVLVADINIGYEDIVNTQVSDSCYSFDTRVNCRNYP